MAIVFGHKTKILYAGTPTSIGTETLSDTGNGTLWEIDNLDKDVWDPTTDITVEVDTGGGFSEVTTGFTIQYLVGRIDFDNDQSGNNVRVTSGDYYPKYQVLDATSWSVDEWGPNMTAPDIVDEDGTRRIARRQDFTASFTYLDDMGNRLDEEVGTPSEERVANVIQNNSLTIARFITNTTQSDPKGAITSIGYLQTGNPSGGDNIVQSQLQFVGSLQQANSNNPNDPRIARYRT